MRGCGLKFFLSLRPFDTARVTLSARVWIEIAYRDIFFVCKLVTLSARVWIEMTNPYMKGDKVICHPQCEGVD